MANTTTASVVYFANRARDNDTTASTGWPWSNWPPADDRVVFNAPTSAPAPARCTCASLGIRCPGERDDSAEEWQRKHRRALRALGREMSRSELAPPRAPALLLPPRPAPATWAAALKAFR